jgi:hypothetical protein
LRSRTSIHVSGAVRAETARARSVRILLRQITSRIGWSLPFSWIQVAGIAGTKVSESRATAVLLRRIISRIHRPLTVSGIHIAGIVGTKVPGSWATAILLRLIDRWISTTIASTLPRPLYWTAHASVAEEALVCAGATWDSARVHLTIRWTKTFARRCDGMPSGNYGCLAKRSFVEPLLVLRHPSASKLIRSHGADSGTHTWIAKCPVDVREAAPFS